MITKHETIIDVAKTKPGVSERPIYLLRLRPEPHVVDPIRALRRGLKYLLRQTGLRCVDVKEEQL
jgi:hypothetical protein